MIIVEIEGLTKKYNGLTAVDNINFTIEEGEIFGFLGPNGAGKTSTINMLIGLAKISGGKAKISGFDCINEGTKVQSLIGIVPDESNLYPEMSGFDNLVFCASLYGMKKEKREEKANSLLKLFGLSKVGKKPFKAYSKGMKRKLTIAAGIIHEPKILFLDEPTTGIDVASARQIRELIKGLNKKGTTIFLTTHYIEEAQRLCHRIAFIVDGKIVKVGKVSDLMEDAQKEKIVQFTLNKKVKNIIEDIKKDFPNNKANAETENTIKIKSNKSIELMPFMNYFTSKGFEVYEARIIKPSLEEIFVKITGLEVSSMKEEREGGKK